MGKGSRVDWRRGNWKLTDLQMYNCVNLSVDHSCIKSSRREIRPSSKIATKMHAQCIVGDTIGLYWLIARIVERHLYIFTALMLRKIREWKPGYEETWEEIDASSGMYIHVVNYYLSSILQNRPKLWLSKILSERARKRIRKPICHGKMQLQHPHLGYHTCLVK